MGDVRPVDVIEIVIEASVLIVIAYELGKKICSNRRAREFWGLLEDGERLANGLNWEMCQSSPSPAQQDAAAAWGRSAEAWKSRTRERLEKKSPKAAAAFRQIGQLGFRDRIVRQAAGNWQPVPGMLGNQYQELLAALANLQRIVENPETFF